MPEMFIMRGTGGGRNEGEDSGTLSEAGVGMAASGGRNAFRQR